jgi:hypothetical protein
MKRFVIISAFFAASFAALSSQETDPSWGIKFTGYIKNDIFYDTRQSTASNGLREGHFYLYPDNVLSDADGNDINANPSFHMLSIQTRIKGDITGPDAFGAKTSGTIEAEFFGTSEADLNGFRLRHAFVKLDWTKTSVLTGQFWHPMFPVESFPGTISFNTGAPFTPFSRNPQVRLTQKLGPASLSLIAYTQRDFTSAGPDGNSNKYLRNSGLPGFHFQLRLPAGENFTSWAGVDYKKLRPELRTNLNGESESTVDGYSVFVNIKIKTEPVIVSLMGVYGQNTSDLMMIGGYAISGISGDYDQYKTYTTLNTANFWADLTTNGRKISLGFFTGFSKNLGAGDVIVGSTYGRGSNIDYLLRFSPRIIFTGGRFSFGTELESTTAAYGTAGTDGKVNNSSSVTNLRVLLSTVYRF